MSERAGTPVNSTELRRVLRRNGITPKLVHHIWTQGDETTIRFMWSADAARALRVLRANWSDGARRVTGGPGSLVVQIRRAGAADVGPAPARPRAFRVELDGVDLSDRAWAWIVWAVLHNGGELDGVAPEMPNNMLFALLPTPWIAMGPPRASRPGKYTVIVSAAARALVGAPQATSP